MKKAFPLAALLLTSASLWSFYPSEDQPGVYMQLDAYSVEGRGTIVAIAPDGKVSISQIKEMDAPLARAKTTLKLNELRREGWQVVQMTNRPPYVSSNGGYNYNIGFNETYLLEKR